MEIVGYVHWYSTLRNSISLPIFVLREIVHFFVIHEFWIAFTKGSSTFI